MMLYAQDHFGFLSDEMLEEIARRLDLNIIQVTETLAYYSMLRRKPAGTLSHPGLHEYFLHGARRQRTSRAREERAWASATRKSRESGTFSLEEVECMGACTGAPCHAGELRLLRESRSRQSRRASRAACRTARSRAPVAVTSGALHERLPAEVPVISKRFGMRNSRKIDTYLQTEGYQALEKALKQMTPDQIIDEVKKSNLRGRGGAGFPAGMKWSFVPKETGGKPKYILANGDESEPGTCKDRPLMEMDPHQLIEGMVIAGKAVDAHRGFIYIRGEYRYVLDIMDVAIAEAYAKGYLGKNILGSGFDFDLITHTGAGAYECGEESALMESLEGKRGYPRIRPPFPAVVGLYGCPTVINNVETLSTVPAIIRRRRRMVRRPRHAAKTAARGSIPSPAT